MDDRTVTVPLAWFPRLAHGERVVTRSQKPASAGLLPGVTLTPLKALS
jgi:hypothetical protein